MLNLLILKNPAILRKQKPIVSMYLGNEVHFNTRIYLKEHQSLAVSEFLLTMNAGCPL